MNDKDIHLSGMHFTFQSINYTVYKIQTRRVANISSRYTSGENLKPGVVAYTCNPASQVAKFQNDLGSLQAGGNKGRVDCVDNCHLAKGEEN